MSYTMKVVEVGANRLHELPADAVTRDVPGRTARAPLLPLAYRSPRDVFYVSSDRWPELEGRALRLNVEERRAPRDAPASAPR